MRTILTILLGIVSICANAQEYKTMFPNGRRWVCVSQRPDGETKPNSFYSISVMGDTIIEGKQCKKLLCEYPSRIVVEVAYENEGKLYKWDVHYNRGFILLMDFNMHAGDVYTVEEGQGYTIEKEMLEEDSIEVRGVKYRRLRMKNRGTEQLYWVEGIGSNTADAWFDVGATSDGYVGHLYECQDYGKVIFTCEDFFLSSTTGVGTVLDRRKSDGKTYNISGMQTDKPETGSIYIRNGKKYVGR